ncbi:MAG: site-2 protease family protein [Anaerolineae bacterium]|nr:site-2 protease family protein [Anaerolineae bacterium]
MTLPDSNNTEILTTIVRRCMTIQEVTWGTTQDPFEVRFRGRLLLESDEAYDLLAEKTRPHTLTPILQESEGQHIILLVKGLIEPGPSNPWINLALFLATLLSMLLAGAAYSYKPPTDMTEMEIYLTLFGKLDSGISFAVSLLSILLAHEFGHYLAARYHKTPVTLPYFLPLPLLGGFGTLGAAIRLKAPPKNKRVLLDIGIAGPLAGLVVAIPIVLYGLSLSELGTIPEIFPPGEGTVLEGNSLLYLGLKYIAHGKLLPMPLSYGSLPAPLYWLRYLFTGLPLPFGAEDVLLHPIAWAGWAGLLVTAINLIPTGQLDGGHTLYSLFGDKVQRIRPFILLLVALMGFVYSGWWLWLAIIYFLGRNHAQPLDQVTRLDPTRRTLAILTLVIFILVFTPVPLRLMFNAAPGL